MLRNEAVISRTALIVPLEIQRFLPILRSIIKTETMDLYGYEHGTPKTLTSYARSVAGVDAFDKREQLIIENINVLSDEGPV